MAHISIPHSPTHIISVDAEAAYLHGDIFAVGAALISVPERRVVSTFAARVSRNSPDWARVQGRATPFVIENVIPAVDAASWDLETSDTRGMLSAFMYWWLCNKSSPDRVNPRVLHAFAEQVYTGDADGGVRRISNLFAYYRQIGDRLRQRDRFVPMTVADHGHPIEHTLFAAPIRAWCKDSNALVDGIDLCGPNPLHEIATLRSSVALATRWPAETFAKAQLADLPSWGLNVPEKSLVVHNPLVDATLSGAHAVQLVDALHNVSQNARVFVVQILGAVGMLADAQPENRKYYLGKIAAAQWLSQQWGVDVSKYIPSRVAEELRGFVSTMQPMSSTDLSKAAKERSGDPCK